MGGLVANLYLRLPAGQQQGWQAQTALQPHTNPCQTLSQLPAGQQQVWDP